jgi:hypothetical protein
LAEDCYYIVSFHGRSVTSGDCAARDWNKMLTVAQMHAGTLTRRNHPERGLTAELRLPRSQRRSTHFE